MLWLFRALTDGLKALFGFIRVERIVSQESVPYDEEIRVPSMNPLLSSPSRIFCSSYLARAPRTLAVDGFFPRLLLLPGRTSPGGSSCRRVLSTGGFTWGTPVRVSDAGDYLLSVSASWPKHLSLYSPTGDPSKPGTGSTLLFYGGVAAHPEPCRPPGPVFNATKPSFHPDFFESALLPGSTRPTLVCLAKRSPALQACNRMRNSQADGAPKALVPGTQGPRFLFPLDARVHALKNARLSLANA